ncbi:MAG TPA: hypothetical protein PK680_00770 [Novosphingobium sp.]|nr:hypothetical protein [Novosphingobium sp.]HQA16891.1 hypothetical protein [Novosphingobium sp.]
MPDLLPAALPSPGDGGKHGACFDAAEVWENRAARRFSVQKCHTGPAGSVDS